MSPYDLLADSSGSCEVKLWCFKGGELARFDDASSPVFTSDDEYLLYAEGGKSIEVFCLKTMQGKGAHVVGIVEK